MGLVIVSNRLPVVLERTDSGTRVRSGTGGLVTALEPVLRRYGGLWIGWPGEAPEDREALEAALAGYSDATGCALRPVWLTPEELQGFYHGFSNEIIWPLFHDLQSRCNFVPDYWTAYVAVNEKFADVVGAETQPADFVWVHDYHLMDLGHRLRSRGLRNPLGFFLHIPFPPPDIFFKLPWRAQVLHGLLQYDVVGFQTPRDRDNFTDCVRKLMPAVRLRRRRGGLTAEHLKHMAVVGAFPIGIDYQEFGVGAATREVTERVQALRAELPDRQIVLGLDRLDYTKGVPYRLKAFALALERYPDLHRRVTLLQVVIPSREAVPEYQDLKAEIERLVSQINGRFTQPGWIPIHYVFRSLEREELLAYYRTADVGFVTPLKDGMNLIAKEYCACQVEGDGVLILSEFAGAASQLHRDAILVNPYDLEAVADALQRAVSMSHAERRPAMRRLRRLMQRQDVYWWLDRFLTACGVDLKAPAICGRAASGTVADTDGASPAGAAGTGPASRTLPAWQAVEANQR
ncbi:MAG TPA: trehalose-6-phosphate synthase [Phycisphaerae bacterium]|nr:trehalose-6-phosphate synthase [Phycisphaerae bacterium]HNU45100.1 trehalose-6-phosphate synthase [Phycisphaerae bacterium]